MTTATAAITAEAAGYFDLGVVKFTTGALAGKRYAVAASGWTSPTFTLVQFYPAERFPLAHFDLYRLTRAEEAYEIGLDEALEDGAALIEWPQRLDGRLPGHRLDIEIAMEGGGRTARLTPHGAWEGRPIEF